MAEEIKIVITADESGAIQSFNNVEESAESLDKTASGISNSLNKAFSGTKNVEQYGQAVRKTGLRFRKYTIYSSLRSISCCYRR